ncbi:hypothetical protein DWG18_13860 [Lysobacter sp. TY2-98]|uniref:hypothetical protein n=1 Tax=Lysobacter sp. TY2-98 TaxID=2290922 RepID=UPI000E201D8D|nr:hypothetical protein [Lysobacter sp. TY2-98]AXK73258.1 hypothetical protein DWG18_13860 [Lysobacter sp. TY2-98]
MTLRALRRLRPRALSVAATLCITCTPVAAQSFHVQGAIDGRVGTTTADSASGFDGGLGKGRLGAGDGHFDVHGALLADWQITPALLASAEVRYAPESRKPLDVLDAWVRWRPVSTSAWRGSVKAGMFFPPISLENDAIGWTSPYTITPSALNTWVGEELRTLGVEGRVEHRGVRGTLSASLALFQKNDPAGELLATRGWAMHDIVSGLDGSLREPDSVVALFGGTVPVRFRPYLEIDHRIGGYAAIDWQTPAQDRLTAIVYDNRTDPAREVDYAGRELYGWRTRFTSVGGQHRFGDTLVIAQAMRGSTIIEPVPDLQVDTRFAAGYLLAAYDVGAWRPAARIDLFQAKQTPGGGMFAMDEHGHAFTLALNWRPDDRWRVTGEVLQIDSTRNQRRRDGVDPRQGELQVQANVRLLF